VARKPIGEGEPPLQPTHRHLWLAVRATVTLAILTFFASRIDWPRQWHDLLGLDRGWLTVAIALAGVSFVVASVRWHALMSVQGIVIGWRMVLRLTLVGQFFSVFLLGATGGDVVKLFAVSRIVPGRTEAAFYSIVVDRALGLASFVAIALSALLLIFGTQGDAVTASVIAGLTVALGVMTLAGVTLLLLDARVVPRGLVRLATALPIYSLLKAGVSKLGLYVRAPRQTMLCALYSLGIALLSFAVADCLARALSIPVGLLPMAAAVAVAVCLSSLPISVGGHGVREGAFVLMFSILKILDESSRLAQDRTVLFSVLFFSVYAIWGLPGGLFYLLHWGRVQTPPRPAGSP